MNLTFLNNKGDIDKGDIEGGLVYEVEAINDKQANKNISNNKSGNTDNFEDDQSANMSTHSHENKTDQQVVVDDDSLVIIPKFIRMTSHIWTLTAIIILLGMVTSAAFLGIGISGSRDQMQDEFNRYATDTANKISEAFEDYVNAASLVHNRCRHRNFTRYDFRELYEYLVAGGLEFKAVQFDPNITHSERPNYEKEAYNFYAQHYPHINYRGFVGFNYANSTSLQPRIKQDFYFPIHYMEPIPGNEAAIDLDYHSSESRIRAVNALFDNQSPSLTDRLSLVKEAGSVSRCGNHNGPSYGVVLMHPGVNLTYVETFPRPADNQWPKDFSSIVICIPDLLRRSTTGSAGGSEVYIHDLSHPNSDEPVFMGGVRVVNKDTGDSRDTTLELDLTFLDEVPLYELNGFRLFQQSEVAAANRIWVVTVIALDGTYQANITFVVLGGAIIFVASVCVALWVCNNSRRLAKFNQMKTEAEAEKAALILSNAHQATKAERELNDFIAHEVRNPVAAAMAACNFVKVAVDKKEPLVDEESRRVAREDVTIIDNSLRFVNDLLRNMLDMHRAANKQLQVSMAPTDVLHDILEPVGGMLHQRGGKVKLIVDCNPTNLFVMTDRLRLKQVMMNLGRNSSKFVDEGFIRLSARVMNDNVLLFVDDSGSGIPLEKRTRLFSKFQESLDVLNQGTGIGLFLCKTLVELMGGEIDLDYDYNSGIPGHPGTRFVINLQQPPIKDTTLLELSSVHYNSNHRGEIRREQLMQKLSPPQHDDDDLPDELSVLFVDDDPILRKLFARSLKSVKPGWVIREAANGEAALRLTTGGVGRSGSNNNISVIKEDPFEQDGSGAMMASDSENGCMEHVEHFDLIFIDMYMASVEKQLLGTETVREMRASGVKSRICGLSANDKESEFYQAGADAFVYKPFPCQPNELKRMLYQILYVDQKDEIDSSSRSIAF